MEIGERIKLARKELNKTQQEFADSIGLKRNTIANYEIGQVQPSDRTIADICRVHNVSEEWLRTGQGEMFVQISPDEELDYILGQIDAGADETIVRIIRAYWKLDEKEKAAVRKLIDNLTEQ